MTHSDKTKQFILKSQKIFGFKKLIYDKVIYVSRETPIILICPIHGEFEQKPREHLRGKTPGCKQCLWIFLRDSQQSFIQKSKKIYGDKNIYNLVQYKNSYEPIILVCVLHGEYKTIPNSHLQGKMGCKQCSTIIKSKCQVSNAKEFIKKAKQRGLSKNNTYENVIYKNSITKVNITCKKHGSYFSKPNDHLSGYGCPKCNASKGELAILHYLSSNQISFKYQIRFRDCKNKKPLPFDFGIYQKDKLLGLIEYQGKQHFMPIQIFGDLNSLKKTKKNDSIKKKYCKQNKIPLLEIPYWEQKNMSAIICKFIELINTTNTDFLGLNTCDIVK